MAISKEKIGSRLEAARKWRGVARAEMADVLGKSERTIQNVEKGMGVNDLYVKAYADRLQVSYDWLLRGEGEMSDAIVPIQVFDPTLEPGKVKEPGVAYITQAAMDRIGDLVDAVGDDAELRIRMLAVLKELKQTANPEELNRIASFEDELLTGRLGRSPE